MRLLPPLLLSRRALEIDLQREGLKQLAPATLEACEAGTQPDEQSAAENAAVAEDSIEDCRQRARATALERELGQRRPMARKWEACWARFSSRFLAQKRET